MVVANAFALYCLISVVVIKLLVAQLVWRSIQASV